MMNNRAKNTNRNNIANNNNNEYNKELVRFSLRLCTAAFLHPFEYSKTLIQLGYEPLPPVPAKYPFYRNTVLFLPNILQYTSYIHRGDAIYNCYRGLAPKLVGCMFSMAVNENLATKLGLDINDDEYDGRSSRAYGNNIAKRILQLDSYDKYKKHLKRDIILTVSSVIVTQPFHVISIRMMAQYVGQDKLYITAVQSIIEIYKQEGLLGFYAGLMPKLLADTLNVILTSSAVYLLTKYIIKNKLERYYSERLVKLGVSTLLYPLQVVTTCMCVTGCRLMAGQPPFMPVYKNWFDCMTDLRMRGELRRGGCMFFRRATENGHK